MSLEQQAYIDDLREQVERLRGELKRYEHIVAVLKGAIGMARMSAEQIEVNTRVQDGRVEVFFLGEWLDVENEREDAEEAKEKS